MPSALVAAAVTIVNAISPSSTSSFTPVTVTVCGVAQLAAVKVRLAGATVPSVVSLLEIPVETSAVGSAFRTTVKVAVPPASVVLPLIADTVNPDVSSSRLIKVASAGLKRL